MGVAGRGGPAYILSDDVPQGEGALPRSAAAQEASKRNQRTTQWSTPTDIEHAQLHVDVFPTT